MKEKQKHREAFELYFAMGPGRSLTRLAAKLGVSESTVKMWSRVFRWAERIEERGRQAAASLVKQAGDTAEDELAKDKQIVRLGLAHVTKSLVEGRLKGNVSDIERMIRLKRELDADGRRGQDMVFQVTWPSAVGPDPDAEGDVYGQGGADGEPPGPGPPMLPRDDPPAPESDPI